MAKVYGHWITVNYRESYDLFAVSGILFNHESPRRGLEFVPRKVTHGVARIWPGFPDELRLGNLESRRDWGYRRRLRRGMWMMLQQDSARRLRAGTGETHVGEFVRIAFEHVGLDWEKYVVIDPRYYRPAEVDLLVGDPAKARKSAGLGTLRHVQRTGRMMVDADLAYAGRNGTATHIAEHQLVSCR